MLYILKKILLDLTVFQGKTEEIEDSELEIDDHLSIFKRDLGTGHAKRLLIWRKGFLTPLKMGLYKTFLGRKQRYSNGESEKALHTARYGNEEDRLDLFSMPTLSRQRQKYFCVKIISNFTEVRFAGVANPELLNIPVDRRLG